MKFGPKELETISQRTGLPVSKVVDLLDRGYTYVEGVDCTPRWESPMGRKVTL